MNAAITNDMEKPLENAEVRTNHHCRILLLFI